MPRAKNKPITQKKAAPKPSSTSPRVEARRAKSEKKRKAINQSREVANPIKEKPQPEVSARIEASEQPASSKLLGVDKSSPLRWRAYEFYYHQKDFGWYMLAILGSLIVAVLAWVFSGFDDYISSGVILVALLGLIAYAGRKPEKKDYEIDISGLKINGQFFGFGMFRHFWIETFDTHSEVTLVGLKKTTPPITLYVKDKELASHVMERVGANLPEDLPSRNPFDWLSRKIKF